jgi:hypothetical protein
MYGCLTFLKIYVCFDRLLYVKRAINIQDCGRFYYNKKFIKPQLWHVLLYIKPTAVIQYREQLELQPHVFEIITFTLIILSSDYVK